MADRALPDEATPACLRYLDGARRDGARLSVLGARPGNGPDVSLSSRVPSTEHRAPSLPVEAEHREPSTEHHPSAISLGAVLAWLPVLLVAAAVWWIGERLGWGKGEGANDG